MGAQSSRTRTLTLENEDPASVIKVSDEVVNRLKGSEEVRKRNATAQHPTVPPPGIPVDSPPPFYHYEPSLTSLQIRQEASEKLKRNDEYWEKRVNNLEMNHEKMRIVMEQEFRKAMEEMSLPENDRAQKCDVPCLSNKKKVVECYKKYPNEPMRCAKEVQAFAACVDSSRVVMVDNKA